MRIALIAVILATLTGCNIDYSDGFRVGTITKFSRRGYVCKTWEGEMNLGGFRNRRDGNGNTQVVANQWAFTVKDDDVASREALSTAMETGQRVKIAYAQIVLPTPCTTDSKYFVTKVDLLKDE